MKPKRYIHTLYRTALCLVATLMATACADHVDTPDTPSTTLPDVEPGSVVLSIAGLPATRAESEGTGKVVEQLDVLMFKEGDTDKKCVYHRRFKLNSDLQTCSESYGGETYTHYAVLGHKADFQKNEDYYIYVLANTHADVNPDATESTTEPTMQEKLDALFPIGCSKATPSDGSMDDLKTFVYTTANIHLSGEESSFPNRFLMDGRVTDGTQQTAIPNEGNMLEPTRFYATLSRAAAKVTVTLTADPSEKHTVILPDPSWEPTLNSQEKGEKPRYAWQNVNQREDTYLLTPDNYGNAGNELHDFPAAAELKSPELTTYNITVNPGLGNTDDKTVGTFTATTYSYSHYWADTESSFEEATFLTVRVPIIYCEKGIPEEFDYQAAIWTADVPATEGTAPSRYTTTVKVNENGSTTERTIYYYVANYYKIPMGKDGRMDRNTHYYVTGNVIRPGSTTADQPMKIEDVKFQVIDWESIPINAGGESNIHYLFVNKTEYEIRNVDSDNTLTFSSSSPVTVQVKEAYFTDKEKNKKYYYKDFQKNAEGGYTNARGELLDVEITTEHDANALNGTITLHSPVPDNNLPRVIVLYIENQNGDHEEVTITQYPLNWIQLTEGLYSYWDADGFSTYDYQWIGTNITPVVGAGKTSTVGVWSGSNNNTESQGVFTAKIAVPQGTDYDNKMSSYYYARNNGWNGYYYVTQGWAPNQGNWQDYRMYHIQITSTFTPEDFPEDCVLARPLRDENGHTLYDEENAKRVSPSFMINSQLGATTSNVASFDEKDDFATLLSKLNWAHSYADHYAEVFIDSKGRKRAYTDWRLPTAAEIKIISMYQGTDGKLGSKPNNESDAMFVVMNGKTYWTATGIATNGVEKDANGNVIANFPDAASNNLRLVRDVYEGEEDGILLDEAFSDPAKWREARRN